MAARYPRAALTRKAMLSREIFRADLPQAGRYQRQVTDLPKGLGLEASGAQPAVKTFLRRTYDKPDLRSAFQAMCLKACF